MLKNVKSYIKMIFFLSFVLFIVDFDMKNPYIWSIKN